MFNPALGVLFIYYLYITEHTSEKCSSIIQIDEHFFCNKFIYKYVGEQLLDTYRVTFFGHRDFNDHRRIEGTLFQTIRDLLISKAFVEFYIGRNGEFDRFCASVIKRVQDAMGKENSELILVLPYTDKDIEYYEKYYDDVMIPETIEKTHPKGAIGKRNRWMIENSDLLICYVDKQEGGAYTALNFAKKNDKKIVNLAKMELEL